MSQLNTVTRGELSGNFDEVRIQVEEVKSLLEAIQMQHDNTSVTDQLSGVRRLLTLLDSDLGKLQRQADELEAWALVSVQRAKEGKV